MFKTKLKTRKSGGDNWRKDDGTSLIAKFRLYDEVAPQDRDRVRSRINDLTHPGHTNYLVEYADFVNSPAYTNRFNHELLDIKLDVTRTPLTAIGMGLGVDLLFNSYKEFPVGEVIDFVDLHNYLLTGKTSKNLVDSVDIAEVAGVEENSPTPF